MNSQADVIRDVCHRLGEGDRAGAADLARTKYPFLATTNAGRSFTAYQMTRVFAKDGFIDRYTGKRLVFPGTLRLLSALMPEEFPAHPNWKMTESHIVYWELFPTIDHVDPVARGGVDDESNWVTTSMLKNCAKSNWTLEELGWSAVPAGSLSEWDGLMPWFVEHTASQPELVNTTYLKTWRSAAVRVLAERANPLK